MYACKSHHFTHNLLRWMYNENVFSYNSTAICVMSLIFREEKIFYVVNINVDITSTYP